MSVASDSALVVLIKQRRERLLRASAGPNAQLVFLDNRLTPTPECILRDPVLNPYDKILWQGILALAQTESAPGSAGAGTVMPTYEQLSHLVNVSRMSIATSIAALRATRWLIVNQIRDAGGAMRGQLYVIAYQPWDLSYALDIDDRYIDWLETQTEERRDRRIQRIAQAVWDTIAEDRRNGVDVMAPIDPLQRTLDARAALHDQSARFYAIGANALKALTRRQAEALTDPNVLRMAPGDAGRSDPDSDNAAENRRVRKTDSVSPRAAIDAPSRVDCCNSDRMTTSRSSSSNLYKNTTTTKTDAAILTACQQLIFPPSLRPIDRQRIGKVLLALLPGQLAAQQLLLDELGGRMQWGAGFKGGPAAWFKGTAQAYLRMNDAFVPNYADKYARYREREAAAEHERHERARPLSDAERQCASAALQRIRQQLPPRRATRPRQS